MKRKRLLTWVAPLLSLLLLWATITALIQAQEAEQYRTEAETLRVELAEVTRQLMQPAMEDEGESPTPVEIYLSWRETYPEGYDNLVRWGRGEPPPLPLSPSMVEACEIAAAGQNIDDYLAHWPTSPLVGYGQDFAYAGWRYSVNPYLLIALTAAETTFATNGLTVRLHNAWCMKGPQPQLGIPAVDGWCSWPDWPTAIDGAAQFLRHYWPGAQTAYDLRGYCEGNPPSWIRNVEVVRKAIGGVM